MASTETVHQEKSLHERIRDDVETRIMTGEWPPGHRIPFEHEITRQYACSRMTVNKALAELVQRGLIERRRRLGTFVRQPHVQSAVLEIHDIEREVQALGLVYGYRLDRRVLRGANEKDRAAMELPEGANVVELTSTHFAGGRPFCLEERVINVDAVPGSESADFSEIGPGTWLLKMVPWSAAEHRITAVAADRRIATALGIAVGAACLVIHRRTWHGPDYITDVHVTYPGERHSLVAQFSPSQKN
ncbi:histidine utilization repressor [Agrobacterium tumefaciens]|uniref:histidine utilization repressor n=1 Tax=Agrobacterium tumefaciens TaxID=358 RepID=UPI00287EF45E|nr:histidine utilization repressor [Agrobacterium tumefaciens]MDS7595829.1 histidine utilization repressor [Agrobacterium tumefaciens]